MVGSAGHQDEGPAPHPAAPQPGHGAAQVEMRFRPDGGQQFHGLGVAVTGSGSRGALPGPQLRAEATLEEVSGRRCGSPHGLLEGLGIGIAVGALIEEHQGPRLPGHLELLDHELVALGRRRPVHPAQIVADLVFPQGEEVLAAVGGEGGPGRLGCRVVAPHGGEPGELVDAGVDDEPVGGTGRRRAVGKGERVGDSHHGRSDPVDASAAAEDLVAGDQRLTGAGASSGELGDAQAVNRVAHREVAHSARCGHVDFDHDLVTLVCLDRVQPPVDVDAGGGVAHEQHAGSGGDRQEQGGGQHLELAEDDPQQGQGGGHAEGHPPAPRRHQAPTLVPGTGTPCAMPSTISPRSEPRIWASGRRMSRWVSTGRSIALTSSGVT